jgi:hypothetical protein
MTKKMVTKKDKTNSVRKGTPDLPIFCVYLYHFNGNTLKQYEIIDCDTPVYEGNETDRVMQGKIEIIIQNAVNNTPPYYCDGNKIFMRRKSILVFAFESVEPTTQNGHATFQSYMGNDGSHTFYNHRYFTFTRDGRKYDVSYCLNRMRSTDGGDLADLEYERFAIDLPFQKKRGRQPGTGGTNQGPPVGPPDRKKKR